MNEYTPNPQLPSPEDAREMSRTLSGISAQRDQLATRLQYVSDLLADAGPLGQEPVLVWRETDRAVKHAAIASEFVVGRQSAAVGSALREDNLLGRQHFRIQADKEDFLLEDLNSRNGTFVNAPEKRIQRRLLRNGDLILAGNHIFAFLNPRMG
jgi:FHA domain